MQILKNTYILVMELDLIEDLIFGVDMSSSIHIDHKKKDKLVLGRGPTQWLESTLTAEKMYSINFTTSKKRFCLS